MFVTSRNPGLVTKFATFTGVVVIELVCIIACVPVLGITNKLLLLGVKGTVCVTEVPSRYKIVPEETPLIPAAPVGPVYPVVPIEPVGPVPPAVPVLPVGPV